MIAEPLEALERELQIVAPGARAELLAPLEGSQNRHAMVRLSDASNWFVKLYARPGHFRAESLALEAIGRRFDWPILPVAGSDRGSIAWLAFPFINLEAVESSVTVVLEWGKLLAEVHSCLPPAGLSQTPRAVDLIDQRLAKLRTYDISFVKRASRLADSLWLGVESTLGVEARMHHETNRLLIHDFGFRNTYRRSDGTMLLIDFERSALGDPHWDLGKAWDRELRNPAYASEFITAYRATLGAGSSWPHAPTLWVTRFAAALAAIPYALDVGDFPFMEEAYGMLQRLETEI